MNTRAWHWAAGALGACGVVLLALVETGWAPLQDADRALSHRLHRVAVEQSGFTRLNRILTDWVWDPITTRLLALATVVTLYIRRARRLAVWAALTSVVGLAMQYAIRAAVARDRPSHPDPVDSAHNFAFPSGHVMAATITCGLLLVLLHATSPAHRGWRTAAWAAALVSVIGVGFTRAFLGVHWPTDVLAGWLFGATAVAACTAAFAPRAHRASVGTTGLRVTRP